MIHITLPDGTRREYDQPLSVFEVAASISLGLAKAAVAGRVNGMLVECGFVIRQDSRVSILTAREPQGLEILRRSCALLLAMAIKQRFSEATIIGGAVVGDGFYCELSHEPPLQPEDLPLIETRMQALAAANHSMAYLVPCYQLEDVEALGEGPHVPSTHVIQAFSLEHLVGTTRQRIYGVCWPNQQELDSWRAPQQVVVININERQADYAQSVTETLRRSGLSARSDLRNEKIANKLRHHHQQGVPYLVVIGDKELDGNFVSVRTGAGENLGRLPVEGVCELLRSERL
ncbi:threonyl-tRNA synthetase [Pseudomonas sp. ok272]|uniref:His/Gly/Thr/Pro-type tRNA ligase C-terminal domain-containing protein n=1 Tax=unclassified Pseudomonas TaxID=196821 RepID=UPI0008D1EDCE|nr:MULTISPECIES: His/Gly/Thr/Pro-type tRNA ligase C-terminal domain-containing protein [unclassified Pseudomonas]SEM61591.1 threonyl-tRNA synthetase [Pseudomonas sp. ok272]SFM48604.1 threonyl-tRNA synthetase [Pseudomonas sp. ok602]